MKRGDWVRLLLVLMLGAALRLGFMQGVVAGDSAQYAATAARMARGPLRIEPNAYGLRFGLVVPVAVAFRLFGVNDPSAALLPLGFSLASIAAACWLGVALEGPALGLAAAWLLCVLPLCIVQGTDLHADLPVAFAYAVAFTALLLASRETTRHRTAHLLLAWCALAWALLTKLTALALFPAIAVAALLLSRGHKRIAAVPLLALLVPVLEAAAFAITQGDPLFRLHSETGGGLHQTQVRAIYSNPTSNFLSAFWEVPSTILAPFPLAWQSTFGWHGLALLLAGITVWKSRPEREWRALWCFTALLYLPLSFAVVNLDFVPAQIRYPRTLEPLCIPMMVVLARWMLDRERRSRVALASSLALVGALSTYSMTLDYELGERPLRRAYTSFREQFGSTPVMTDACSCSLVRFLDEFDPARPCLPFPATPASGLAIVHPRSLATCGEWLEAPKPGWLADLSCQTTLGRFDSRSREVGGALARLRAGQNPLQLLFSLRPQSELDLELRRLTCGDPR